MVKLVEVNTQLKPDGHCVTERVKVEGLHADPSLFCMLTT